MRTAFALIALVLPFSAPAAEWATQRGDAERSGWQRDEKQLNIRTVGNLHLLWKQKLSDTPGSLSDPLMLGPIITHRGIKELVVVQSAEGRVYALDADLGTMFWSRTLQESGRIVPRRNCPPVMPAMSPSPPKTDYGDDEFSDGNQALYVLAESGVLYSLRPSTGENYSPPHSLLESVSTPVGVDALEGVLYATNSLACRDHTDAVVSLPVERTGPQLTAKARRQPLAAYAHSSRDVAASARFEWARKDLLATANEDGSVTIQQTSGAALVFPALARTVRQGPALATFETEDNHRWIVTATHANLSGFQLIAKLGRPEARASWSVQLPGNAIEPGAPVVANGIVYFTAYSPEKGKLTLNALDALTGRQLYTSEAPVRSHSSGDIALANGHVCFVTDDGTLACFGLPFQM